MNIKVLVLKEIDFPLTSLLPLRATDPNWGCQDSYPIMHLISILGPGHFMNVKFPIMNNICIKSLA
jgi:hypothetical protein